MYDCITVGDIALDRFLSLSDTRQQDSQVNPGNKDLLFEIGKKVSIDHTFESIGGNACNVAAGLRKLEKYITIYSHIGGDYTADSLLHQIQNLDIPTDLISQHPQEGTNSATILSLDYDRVIFSYHAPREYQLHSLPPTRWIYLTSLGQGSEPIIDQCLNEKAFLAFNPGSYYMKYKLPTIRKILPFCQVLIINKEEAQKILHTEEESIVSLLSQLHQDIPYPIITDGRHGVYAYDDLQNHILFMPSQPPQHLADTTGAGDAFSSGFLSQFISEHSLAQSLKAGVLNAQAVITTLGATHGLHNQDSLNYALSELDQNPIIVTKERL